MINRFYFNSPERIAALVAETNLWLGTPWCANSDARGANGGVSCHNLPRAIFVGIGALPDSFPRMQGVPNRHARISQMEHFLDSRSELIRVSIKDLQPGDLLGLRLFHCLDHLAILLDDSRFVHVLMHKLTTIDSLTQDQTWSSRLLAAWRLVS